MSTKPNYLLESQKALKAKGFYTGTLDGIWGEKSHKSLEAALAKVPAATTARPAATSPVAAMPATDRYVIDVVRFQETGRSTISRFSCSWCKVTGYFLEPAGPDTKTANQNKRIPVGVYNLVPHTGAKYKGVVRLYNSDVPQSRAILIHQGNTPADTLACLIAGSTYSKDYVGTSTVKLKELMKEVYAVGVTKVKVRITSQIGK